MEPRVQTRLAVLILEDDDVCYLSMTKYLEKVSQAAEGLGLDLTRTTRVADALAALDGGKFDVIFADLNVPDSCGMQTASRMAAHSDKTPIIIVSGVDLSEIDKEKLIEMNIVDFLEKGKIYDTDYVAQHNACRLLMLKAVKEFGSITSG